MTDLEHAIAWAARDCARMAASAGRGDMTQTAQIASSVRGFLDEVEAHLNPNDVRIYEELRQEAKARAAKQEAAA